MGIEKEIARIEGRLDKVFKSTVKDLIDGKYKLVNIGSHSSKLEYRGDVVDVWIANEDWGCNIHSTIVGMKFPELSDEEKGIIFKLATTETPYMIKRELKEANSNKKQAYLKYKEEIKKVKELRLKLKELL